MKKKILVALLAAIMAVAMLPSLVFAESVPYQGGFEVDGYFVYSDDNYEGDNALPGANWTYADGVLTLDGYNGEKINVGPSAEGSGPFTIVLKGENTINMMSGLDGLRIDSTDTILQGTGTLNITGKTNRSAIWISLGTITFDLGVGGEVRMDPVFDPSVRILGEDPMENDSAEAIIAYDMESLSYQPAVWIRLF